MVLFDTHAHLNDPKFNRDIEEVIDRAKIAGLKGILVVGYDLPSSYRAVELAHKYSNLIYASVGVHPHDADEFNNKLLYELESLAKDDKVVAIGETGLDFYKLYSKKESQKNAFSAQIDLASRLSLPIILHVRKAFKEVFEILEKYPNLNKGVFHCFSGGENEAKWVTKRNFWVSFSGSITFGSPKLESALKTLPPHKILIETDSPYLTPHPQRGKRNEPSFLLHILFKVAESLKRDREEIAKLTFENTVSLFSI